MPHQFGCAADSYRRGLHPRILLGPDDLMRLRRQIRRGNGRTIFNGIRAKIAPVVDRLLAAETPQALDELLDPGKSIYASFAAQVEGSIHEMAMVAVLADDARAAQAARRVLVEARAGRDFSPSKTSVRSPTKTPPPVQSAMRCPDMNLTMSA